MLKSKVECPACRHSREISSDDLEHKATVKCSSCGKTFVYRKNISFSNCEHRTFRPSGYLHPLDEQALKFLKGFSGIDTIAKAMMKHSYEKFIRMTHMSDDIKATPRTCGYIFDMAEYSAKRLGVKPPALYITQNPFVNAYTTGIDDPIIVINSGLIELLNDEELLAVIAHETGHIACEHVLYHMLADFLSQFPNLLGVTSLVTGGLRLALLDWSRKSELSADRASLKVVGEKKVIVNMLMKLAGGSFKLYNMIDYDDFVSQYEEVRGLESQFTNKMIVKFATLLRTHPFPIVRANEINSWQGSEHRRRLSLNIGIEYGKK